MTLHFGSSDAPTPRRLRPPPPNYAARTTRWRLFLLVAAVLLVTGVASRFQDPRFRRLFGIDAHPEEARTAADEDVDTRLVARGSSSGASDVIIASAGGDDARRPKPLAEAPLDSAESPALRGEKTAAEKADAEKSGAEENAAERPAEPLDHREALAETWRDACAALLEGLSDADADQLDARLRAARGAGGFRARDDAEGEAWRKRLAAWDDAWNAYLRQARAGLATTPESERPRWSKLLDEAAASWLTLWRPLLENLGAERPEGAELLAAVELLQRVVDDRALAAVRDDTIWRRAETNIWFRLVDRVRGADPADLRRESIGPTGYLQLFKQPEQYRGKLVTVRGTVKLAYRVDAPRDNVSGIDEYVIMWLHPAGGPSSPIVIYALETPEGFPPIRQRDRGEGTTTLYEEVEVTGYFFKRWAYEGRDGIHVAPLLLARAPDRVASPHAAESSGGPSGIALATAIVGAALLAGGLVVFAFRNTQRE